MEDVANPDDDIRLTGRTTFESRCSGCHPNINFIRNRDNATITAAENTVNAHDNVDIWPAGAELDALRAYADDPNI